MRADNSHHVITAADRRAAATRKRAVAALRRMDKSGQLITFDSVAKHAQVSRSWLYTQPDLRAEIERRRTRTNPPPSVQPVPAQKRASDTSLLRRLEAATDRIRRLEAENQQLHEALALALGDHRAGNERFHATA